MEFLDFLGAYYQNVTGSFTLCNRKVCSSLDFKSGYIAFCGQTLRIYKYIMFVCLFVCLVHRLFTPTSTPEGVDFCVHNRFCSRATVLQLQGNIRFEASVNLNLLRGCTV